MVLRLLNKTPAIVSNPASPGDPGRPPTGAPHATQASEFTADGVRFDLGQSGPVDYHVGQYACGTRWWVYAPHGVYWRSSSLPPTMGTVTDTGGEEHPGTVLHGAEVNAGRVYFVGDDLRYFQGFSNYFGNEGAVAGYAHGWNLDPEVPGTLGDPGSTPRGPQLLMPGDAVTKAVWRTTPPAQGRRSANRYVTWHVVDEAPAADALAPPSNGEWAAVPSTWREANLDLSRIPNHAGGRTISHAQLAAAQFDLATLTGFAQRPWVLWFGYANGCRQMAPAQVHYDYRLEQARGDRVSYPGIYELFKAACCDAPIEDRMPIILGLVQMGIDAAGFVERFKDQSATISYGRMDPAKRLLTAFAALLLPDNEFLQTQLDRVASWEDTDSMTLVDAASLAYTDPLWGGGARPDDWHGIHDGMQGRAVWLYDDMAGAHSDVFVYQRIHLATIGPACAAGHLIEGMQTKFDPDQKNLRFIEDWNLKTLANWESATGGGTPIGDGTGYNDNGGTGTGFAQNAFYDDEFDFYRDLKSFISPNIATWAMRPARPEPPVLTVSGTTITVAERNSIIDWGSPVTQTDVRYRKMSATPQATTEPPVSGDYATGWTEVSDVTLPHDLTGLDASSEYLVQIRHRSANGIGAWSRNWDETGLGSWGFWEPSGGGQQARWNLLGRVTTGA